MIRFQGQGKPRGALAWLIGLAMIASLGAQAEPLDWSNIWTKIDQASSEDGFREVSRSMGLAWVKENSELLGVAGGGIELLLEEGTPFAERFKLVSTGLGVLLIAQELAHDLYLGRPGGKTLQTLVKKVGWFLDPLGQAAPPVPDPPTGPSSPKKSGAWVLIETKVKQGGEVQASPGSAVIDYKSYSSQGSWTPPPAQMKPGRVQVDLRSPSRSGPAGGHPSSGTGVAGVPRDREAACGWRIHATSGRETGACLSSKSSPRSLLAFRETCLEEVT